MKILHLFGALSAALWIGAILFFGGCFMVGLYTIISKTTNHITKGMFNGNTTGQKGDAGNAGHGTLVHDGTGATGETGSEGAVEVGPGESQRDPAIRHMQDIATLSGYVLALETARQNHTEKVEGARQETRAGGHHHDSAEAVQHASAKRLSRRTPIHVRAALKVAALKARLRWG